MDLINHCQLVIMLLSQNNNEDFFLFFGWVWLSFLVMLVVKVTWILYITLYKLDGGTDVTNKGYKSQVVVGVRTLVPF